MQSRHPSTADTRPAKQWQYVLLAALSGVLALLITTCALFKSTTPTPTAPSVSSLHVPPGFQITVFAQGLSGPRLITFSPSGTLLVAERGAGRIVALPDPDHTGKASEQITVADNLDDPTSGAKLMMPASSRTGSTQGR